MPEQMSWTMRAQATGGPKLTAAGALDDLDAYGKIEVEVTANGNTTVAVQPGGEGAVRLLMITSDRYESLSYEVLDDEAAVVTTVELDAPQLLVGEGAVGLLGAPPRTLNFINAEPVDGPTATVTILVGRNAT